jgi:tRNA threonylcarbamoyladenosine biosynthesis protein TsaE
VSTLVVSAEEMIELGARLASILVSGDLVCLYGELGAGKTTLVRGIHAGLRCEGRVRSPSFLTLLEYRGVPPLHHFDLYRYEAAGRGFLEEFGEWLHGEAISIVEWAERFGAEAPSPRLDLRIEIVPEGRVVHHQGIGGDWSKRLDAWVS